MRTDISQYLFHWVKGNSDEDALSKLLAIAETRKLLSGNGFIRGRHQCICFTETPLSSFHESESRYKKFGVRLSKQFIFSAGGRPVIYQPNADYDLLPDSLKWRHVTFEPPFVDFSWEREWRLPNEQLELDPELITFVVPKKEFGECLSTTYYSQKYRTVVKAIPENEPPYKTEVQNYRYLVL